ncbi:hypothetical protein Lal_00013729, partial [Lupinus albus]
MINTPAPTKPSLEELVRQMTMQNMQFQQEIRASIQRQESSIHNLTTHIGHMATSLNTLQSYLAPRTFWALQVEDVCKSEDSLLEHPK